MPTGPAAATQAAFFHIMARLLPYRLLVLLATVALLLPASASAQTGVAQAYINDILGPQEVPTTAGLPGLSYEVDVTLLDGQQNVVSSVGVVTATLALTKNGSYPAQVQKQTAPWTMVVLLDASSTMGVFSASADYTQLRTQVSAAVGSLPDGYNISVEKFDALPATILDFTNAKDKVAQAIQKGFQPTTTGNACLNDAVYDAINNLSRAPGRRTLLLVTASLDGCGKGADQALALAKQNHIQIYAVGMLGYKVNAAKDLEYLTKPTGGLAYAREAKDLKFALLNVQQALGLQWSAKATLYPSAGPETATVQLTLSDQTQISTQPVYFNVTKSFAQPPQINLRGAILSTLQGIRFGMDFVSPQLISQLKLNIIDKVTGNSILAQTLGQIQDTYDIPIVNLKVGSTYDVQVIALDKTGAQIGTTGAEFQYQPPAAQFNITNVITPSQAAPYYTVQVESINLDGVVGYRAWLQTDGQTDIINLREVTVGNPITVSTTSLKQGVYDIDVAAIDAAGKVLQTAAPQKLPPFTPPSSLDLALAFLLANPIWIALMGGVFCLALVALLVAVVIILPKPNARPKAVELYVPEVKHRAQPIDLEASRSQPVPRAAPRRDAPDQSPPARPAVAARDLPARDVRAPRDIAPPQSMAEDRRAAPTGMPKACLSGYAPADLRVATTIGKSSYTIGRRDGNDLVLQVDNKVGVSGRHATIKFVDGRFFIVDDKSTFGTFVDDQRLPAGATLPLDDGAIIGLGPKVKIQFRLNCQ